MTDDSRPRVHDATRVRPVLEGTRESPLIRIAEPGDPAVDAEAILARAEALTAQDTRVLRNRYRGRSGNRLAAARPRGRLARRQRGRDPAGPPLAMRRPLAPGGPAPFPELFTATAGRRHPLRPEPPPAPSTPAPFPGSADA
ncbi:hypothetical protein ACRAWG_26710 [Methylobacterium sp. P31]